MLYTILFIICLIAYGVFCHYAKEYQCSQMRINNRVIGLYSRIKNNSVFYADNSYFASSITETKQEGDIYTSQIVSYGDQNTAANGREDNDWMSYTISDDCNTYTLIDAKITGIAPSWAAYVNTPKYYSVLNTPVYVSLKNQYGIAVGLGNSLYTLTGRRFQVISTGVRLYYSYSMALSPVMLKQVAYIPLPESLISAVNSYIGCVIQRGNCGAAYSSISNAYNTFLASARQQVKNPTSPELWQLLGMDDLGEDYLDIDTTGAIIAGKLTYWGVSVTYDPRSINPVQLGVNNTTYYSSIKKVSSARYLRHAVVKDTIVISYIGDNGSIGTMAFDMRGNLK